jgi:hypothetical protein
VLHTAQLDAPNPRLGSTAHADERVMTMTHQDYAVSLKLVFLDAV